MTSPPSELQQFGRTPIASDLVPVGEFHRVVHVFSLSRRTKLAQLETVLDYGGHRLALQETPTPLVIAAAYHRHGVIAYGLDGESRWRRRDLKKCQAMEPLSSGAIAVGMEDKALHIVAGESGETITTARGLSKVFGDPYGTLALGVGRSGTGFAYGYELNSGERLWRQGLTSFTVLDAAFSPDAVLLSEAGGPVTCLDREGRSKWSWGPPVGSHALCVSWSAAGGFWVGVTWPYEQGGPKTLMVWTQDGEIGNSVPIGEPAETAFTRDGSLLMTSSGDVLDVLSAERLWIMQV